MENVLMVKVRKLEDGSLYAVSEDYRMSCIAHNKWEVKQLMQAETSMKVEVTDMYQRQSVR